MATVKTADQKLLDIDKKIEALKEQKKALQNRVNAKARKERNHRLIKIGAEVEAFAKCEIENFDTFKEFLKVHATKISETQKK